VGYFYSPRFSSTLAGKDSLGRIIAVKSAGIEVYDNPVFRTFDPLSRNAIPNPVVSLIQQREATTVLDIDYRVEDADDAAVTTAALAFPDGDQNILSALPLTTFSEGTEANLGEGTATNTRHRISWNAGVDWNVDFGSISVMVLARDSRTFYFDVHLVDIPADGERPALTISRNRLEEYDFTMQWFWLIATNDTSISITDGIIFGQGGTYDAQQLTDSQGKSTAAGRAFLLERDGLRVATPEEVVRAWEGATPGFTVSLAPPNYIRSVDPVPAGRNLPQRINEYGIESYKSTSGYWNYSSSSTNLWYVVPIAP
jgi:hypothetical protein